jgi:hypothetical protein
MWMTDANALVRLFLNMALKLTNRGLFLESPV